MILERIKSEGIAHNSYFLGSENDAVVIDPRRDCMEYISLARQQGMRIRYVFETHRNEDYVAGSSELCKHTGAEVYHGPGLDWRYGNTLSAGQTFEVGRLRLAAIHTPGHTPESVCYTVADMESGGATVMAFTGDTLFVNEVGRCDLLGPGEAPQLAASLYDSIWRKLLPLGDGVIICPAHGGGSVCGARIAARDESTIGLERLHNPLLRLSREDFISHKVVERLEVPPYFRHMEACNLAGAPLLGGLPQPAPLTPAEFNRHMAGGAIVVDTSEPAAFGAAHIKGALSIWLEGLPAFAGWVLPYDRPILLVLQDGSHLDRAVRYLVRVGYDRIAGYLIGGTEGWYNAGQPIEGLPLLSVHQLKHKLDAGEDLAVLDVRGQDEWESGHIAGARHIYVGHLQERLNEVPRAGQIAVHCNVGHRSGLAASILLRAGCKGVHNVLGSIAAWTSAGFPLTTE